jgi:uncharacterized surface protein with fasciclin (FAS1) repeats
MLRKIATMTAVLSLVVALAHAEEKGGKDIVDTAVAAGKFKTLVAAVKAAGLVETLKGEGPFTVFAPTDDAFAKLGEEKIESLLKDPETLKKILLYHVVKGAVPASEAVKLDGKTVETVGGKTLAIEVKDGKVILNGKATVVKADIKTKNGIIHVIDAVLVPGS